MWRWGRQTPIVRGEPYREQSSVSGVIIIFCCQLFLWPSKKSLYFIYLFTVPILHVAEGGKRHSAHPELADILSYSDPEPVHRWWWGRLSNRNEMMGVGVSCVGNNMERRSVPGLLLYSRIIRLNHGSERVDEPPPSTYLVFVGEYI